MHVCEQYSGREILPKAKRCCEAFVPMEELVVDFQYAFARDSNARRVKGIQGAVYCFRQLSEALEYTAYVRRLGTRSIKWCT